MKKNKQSSFEKELHKRLTLAAKSVVKEIDNHFKDDKWPLWYGFYPEEIVYEAFGFHIEKYLIEELRKRKGKYVLRSGNKGSLHENSLMIDLTKNIKVIKNKSKKVMKITL